MTTVLFQTRRWTTDLKSPDILDGYRVTITMVIRQVLQQIFSKQTFQDQQVTFWLRRQGQKTY